MTRRAWLWAVPLLFVVVLFYLPLAHIIALGLSGNWVDRLVEPGTIRVIWFTIWQALASTAISFLLGIPGAYLLYRKRFRGQRVIRAFITVPLVIPSIIVAIAFVNFRFIPAIPLIVLAHVFINYSLVVRTVGSVWANLDNETEEAAALAGAGRMRTLWSISLPQLKPALVSAFALVFLFCVSSFGIIKVLGGGLVNSIETDISMAALDQLDLQKAAALSVLQTLITAVAFIVSERIAGQPVSIESVDEATHKPSVDSRDWPAISVTVLTVIGLIAIPIVSVFTKAFTYDGAFSLNNFAHLGGQGDREILNITVAQAALNTLRNVAISATISLSIGTLVAYLLSRRPHSRLQNYARHTFDVAFLIPIGISSVVLGFGYLITYADEPFALRSSWLVVPIVQSLMAMPLVIRLVYPALVAIGAEHREAAALAGATQPQIFWLIEMGMIKHVVATAVGFAMIASIGEYGAASLLAYGDQATLPTVLYTLISRPGTNNFGMAMAVSAMLIVLTFVLVFAVAGQKLRLPQLAFLKSLRSTPGSGQSE